MLAKHGADLRTGNQFQQLALADNFLYLIHLLQLIKINIYLD